MHWQSPKPLKSSAVGSPSRAAQNGHRTSGSIAALRPVKADLDEMCGVGRGAMLGETAKSAPNALSSEHSLRIKLDQCARKAFSADQWSFGDTSLFDKAFVNACIPPEPPRQHLQSMPFRGYPRDDGKADTGSRTDAFGEWNDWRLGDDEVLLINVFHVGLLDLSPFNSALENLPGSNAAS